MTYQEAKNSGKPFNREIYEDGFYYVDSRGLDCSCIDLSIRNWTKEDLEATDWRISERNAIL